MADNLFINFIIINKGQYRNTHWHTHSFVCCVWIGKREKLKGEKVECISIILNGEKWTGNVLVLIIISRFHRHVLIQQIAQCPVGMGGDQRRRRRWIWPTAKEAFNVDCLDLINDPFQMDNGNIHKLVFFS